MLFIVCNECVGSVFCHLGFVCQEKYGSDSYAQFKAVIMSNVRNGVCMPACLVHTLNGGVGSLSFQNEHETGDDH